MHEYLIASLFPYNVCVTILGEKKRGLPWFSPIRCSVFLRVLLQRKLVLKSGWCPGVAKHTAHESSYDSLDCLLTKDHLISWSYIFLDWLCGLTKTYPQFINITCKKSNISKVIFIQSFITIIATHIHISHPFSVSKLFNNIIISIYLCS